MYSACINYVYTYTCTYIIYCIGSVCVLYVPKKWLPKCPHPRKMAPEGSSLGLDQIFFFGKEGQLLGAHKH